MAWWSSGRGLPASMCLVSSDHPPSRSNDMGWTDALGPPKVEVGYRGRGQTARWENRMAGGGAGSPGDPPAGTLVRVGGGEPHGSWGKLWGDPCRLLVGTVVGAGRAAGGRLYSLPTNSYSVVPWSMKLQDLQEKK